MTKILCIAGFVIALAAGPVLADDGTGLYFSHLDWELACDNTLTCRAAGYQADDDERPVSVLLTRKAGARQAVTGEVRIGSEVSDLLLAQPKPLRLTMSINGRTYGAVTIDKKTLRGELASDQVAGLVSSLSHKSNIEFAKGNTVWHLSDKGGAAVLLKMDDIQGRVGTIGALIRKGSAGEENVRAPIPAPVVVAASVDTPKTGLKPLSERESKYLRNILRRTVKEDDCPKLYDKESGESKISIRPLSGEKRLISTLCWQAAYNDGTGYWIINPSRPYDAALVTTSGTNYSKGAITAYQKGRGMADCVSIDRWTWDGKHFVHTESLTTGMCKMVALGGAWKLPTKVTELHHENSHQKDVPSK